MSDIVARYGGEEFIILTANMAADRYLLHFEKLRKEFGEEPIETSAGNIKATISIGVTTRLADSLEDMIKEGQVDHHKLQTDGEYHGAEQGKVAEQTNRE